MASFLVKHRENVRDGLVPEDYVRHLEYKGQEVALASESKGYRFKLTPPVPVTVLHGDVHGNARATKSVVPLNAARRGSISVSPLPIILQCGGNGTRTSRISEPGLFAPAARKDSALPRAGSPATHAETATNRHGGIARQFTIRSDRPFSDTSCPGTAHPFV